MVCLVYALCKVMKGYHAHDQLPIQDSLSTQAELQVKVQLTTRAALQSVCFQRWLLLNAELDTPVPHRSRHLTVPTSEGVCLAFDLGHAVLTFDALEEARHTKSAVQCLWGSSNC